MRERPAVTGNRLRVLEQAAREVRGELVAMSHRGRAAHLGSALSCVEILLAAYGGPFRLDPRVAQLPQRDALIFSKGHAIAALYAVLAWRGYFPLAWLQTYAQPGTALPEHPTPGCVPGLDHATGSLGHGLPVANGLALAARIAGRDTRVVAVLSDGECNEGSVWEAAAFATAQQLGNLLVVVDANGWQATGRSPEVLALEPLAAKWAAFGWDTREVPGHDLAALVEAYRVPRDATQPRAVIARTVKGRGVSFMEDDNNWHYRIPTAAEVAAAREELGLP